LEEKVDFEKLSIWDYEVLRTTKLEALWTTLKFGRISYIEVQMSPDESR